MVGWPIWRCALAICLFAFVLTSGVPSSTLATVPDFARSQMPSLAPLLRGISAGVVSISGRMHVDQKAPRRNPAVRESRPKSPGDDVQSSASGVVVDAERGYVLTSSHAVDLVSPIDVTTEDGDHYIAILVGRDPPTDIAVLQIPGTTKLKAVPFGDSDKLEVGDFVLAIGNAFGMGQSVTSGIVSALGRGGFRAEGYEDFIQTDAAINPGNSGGALINLRGELVGISSAILAPGGGNVGIGFAVPINQARHVMEQILQYGRVRRGLIGISIQDLTADLAAKLHIERHSGALVTEVSPNSPADQAGIQKQDLVIEIDGAPVRSSAGLRSKVAERAIGDRLQLTFERHGTSHTVSVQVGPTNEKTANRL
jgi:serine protease Do